MSANARLERLFLHLVVTVAAMVGTWCSAAQEQSEAGPTVDVQAAKLPDVDPAYLEPLKNLTSDEKAYVEEMWKLGNEAFKRIDQLKIEIAGSDVESERQAKSAEIAMCVARLVAISELGLKTFDHSAQIHNFMGTVFYDALGRETDGVKEWLAAVSLDSKYSDPHNNLGMHYFHSGHYALGFQNMDRALELDPKNADYCFNMAQNYLIYRPQTEEYRGWKADKIYKEAMKLSKKATKLAPEDFEILQDYAVNFFAAENFGETPDWKAAAKAWQVARKFAPGEVEVYFTWLNEGRAWRASGNKTEARRCFQEALAAAEKNPRLTTNIDLPQRLLKDVSAEN